MRIAMFYHSLLSDWNHGNAHFLRGVVTELLARGHEVEVFEPVDSWSFQNLIASHGDGCISEFQQAYPHLSSTRYDLANLNLEEVLDGVDLVLVHEWNDPGLVARIAEYRRRNGCRVLFHDTHHRSISDSDRIFHRSIERFDGVLAFGQSIATQYRRLGWGPRVWTWHEAADTRVFHPLPRTSDYQGDLVWVGNWGDDERTRELQEFLLEPVRELALRASVFGVRYPDDVLATLAAGGIEYRGWTPNYRVPSVFSRFKVTVHIPRRPYAAILHGVPTIRVFEALACGIPLVSGPWADSEGLFTLGEDFLMAANGAEMEKHLREILSDNDMANEMAVRGRKTILSRHTCAHRVEELLSICRELGLEPGIKRHYSRPAVGVEVPAGTHGGA